MQTQVNGLKAQKDNDQFAQVIKQGNVDIDTLQKKK